MKSKIARQAERELLSFVRRLSQEQRLNAFLEHSQLMMALYEAGVGQRNGTLSPPQKPQ